jgi:hypothetical protein
MTKAKWWTLDTVFMIGLGAVMAGAFGISFFTRLGSHQGSDLVPTVVLQKLVDEGQRCQTITDEEVMSQAPRRSC